MFSLDALTSAQLLVVLLLNAGLTPTSPKISGATTKVHVLHLHHCHKVLHEVPPRKLERLPADQYGDY